MKMKKRFYLDRTGTDREGELEEEKDDDWYVV